MYKKLALLLMVLLSLSMTIFGQGGFGVIAGKVTDAQGASIPGARVVAINQEKGTRVEVVTNDEGIYQIPQLIPGLYLISVEAQNFKKLQQTDIKVAVADKLTINPTLEAGAITETVDVLAETPLLRTQDAQQGEVVTQLMIQNLPQINREPLELLRLAGNVQGGGGRAEGDSDTRINGGRTQSIEYFADGIAQSTGRAHNVSRVTPTTEAIQEFKVITNGLSAEYGRLSGGTVELITRSGSNAFHGQVFEYFRNEKLNANSWRQNLLGGERTGYKQHTFGFAVGGPILLPKFGEGGDTIWNGKNRSFFFFNYEGFRFNESGRLVTRSVPTLEERNGDLSNTRVLGLQAKMYDPFGRSRVIGPNERDENGNLKPEGFIERLDLLGGDGLRVPANRISPAARAILAFVPLPNRAPRADSNFKDNYIGSVSESNEHDTWALRLDHNFTQNSRIFGRFQYLTRNTSATRLFPADLARSNKIDGAFSQTINYDWTISPTWIFNARVGGHYNPYEEGTATDPSVDFSTIPYGGPIQDILGRRPDRGLWIHLAGRDTLIDAPRTRVRNSTTVHSSAAMSKLFTRHTLKFGYEHRRYYDNFSDPADGWMAFLANPVNRYNVDAGWNDQAGHHSLGAFLLGINSVTGVSAERSRANNFNYNAAFIQDDWKVSPKLTLNIGLRWDLETPTSERYDKLYFWDPDAPAPVSIKPGWTWERALRNAGVDPATVKTPAWVTNGLPKGAIRIANTPEHPSRLGQEWNYFQFSPRFGFAYAFNEKTVVRGSAGKVYLSSSGDPNGYSTGGGSIALADAANAGWHRGLSTNFVDGISTLDNPFTPSDISRYQRDNRIANLQATGGDPAAAAFNKKSHQPFEYTWGLSLQREVGAGFLLEASYNANLGRDLLARDLVSRFPKSEFRPENQVKYSTRIETPWLEETRYGSTIPLGLLEYDYPYFGPLQVLASNLGKSNYQSLNLKAERRLGRSYSFLVNYTLSRLLDNVGGPNAHGFEIANGGGTGSKVNQSVDTVRDIYGLSPLDERHRLMASYNIQLPFGRGRRFLRSPDGLGSTLVDYVIGGWDLAGISTWRSGRPVVIPLSNANNSPLRIEATYWKFATNNHDLSNPGFSDKQDVFISDRDLGGWKSQNPNGTLAGRFKSPKGFLLNPADRPFTYGDAYLIENIRHPSSFYHDLSLMKSFPIFGESRYLQIRLEARNLFNMRGFGDYNTNPADPNTFGLITRSRYDPRIMQISGRFVF
jgi:outer membrane receptor protein involved in Fe transport